MDYVAVPLAAGIGGWCGCPSVALGKFACVVAQLGCGNGLHRHVPFRAEWSRLLDVAMSLWIQYVLIHYIAYIRARPMHGSLGEEASGQITGNCDELCTPLDRTNMPNANADRAKGWEGQASK